MYKGLEYLNTIPLWNHKDKFDLENIKKALFYLDNPQDRPKSVHIAGTNGKGTTSAIIASILGNSGFTVGLNISPHLIKINERFIINGVNVESQKLSEAVLEIKLIQERYNIKLTYHEILTIAAFILFKDLDWIVIETGLGGRLDASNVLNKPDLSVITSISFDHKDILGDTLEKIAFEKAGIIKDSSLVIIPNFKDSNITNVFINKAKAESSKIYEIDKDFQVKIMEYKDLPQSDYFTGLTTADRVNLEIAYMDKFITFEGIPNIKSVISNTSLAVSASMLLNIPREHIKRGLKNFYWPARLETIVFRNKKFILDCAHNTESMNILVNYLKHNQLYNIDILFGVLATKDWKNMIAQLIPHIGNWNIVLPDSEVAVKFEDIEMELKSHNVSSITNFDRDYKQAINFVLNSEKLCLVTGSMYMLGSVKEIIDPNIKPIWITT